MKPVRLYGDPFGSGSAAAALRSCLEAGATRGFAVSLCLSAVRSGGSGQATVELGDGSRTFAVQTNLSPAAIAALQRAVATSVPATAPVVVFAPQRWRADMLALAGLEWPLACTVVNGCADAAAPLLDRLDAELRWAGTEDPVLGCDPVQLATWSALPPPVATGPVLHVGASTAMAGSDVAVRAFLRACPDGDRRLRIVLPPSAEAEAVPLGALAVELGGNAALERIEFAVGTLQATHAADCAAILQPLRRLFAGDVLARLLASGRPVVATRFQATAPALAAPGTCMPIGGTLVAGDDGLPWCEPDLDNVVAALRQVLGDSAAARLTGERARRHAIVELSADRPAAPPSRPAMPRSRPTVVLEAPFFETSSSSELSIETALALHRRDLVDLRLLPSAPFRSDLESLRQRAPGLVDHFVRDGGHPDLWLSSGWPPRAERPRCRTLALRLDWEYGALPSNLLPLVSQEADRVIVHSRHVERTVVAAGCPADRVVRVPHGVDGERFHAEAVADAELLAWKGNRPLVLFVGGMVFRKGFDVLLRMALAAGQRGASLALVVKSIGGDQHYAGYHLGELARRFQATRAAPPLLCIDRELPRDRLPGIYRASDLLCHPYRGEGFGLPVLEARACGLPVLVTRGGATDDFTAGAGAIGIPAVRRAIDLPGAHVGQPWLLEPDADCAADALVTALVDLPDLTAAARAQAPAIRATHSWDGAALAIERLAQARLERQPVLVPMPSRSPVSADATPLRL